MPDLTLCLAFVIFTSVLRPRRPVQSLKLLQGNTGLICAPALSTWLALYGMWVVDLSNEWMTFQ